MKNHVLAGLAVATTMGFFTPLTSHAFGLGKIEVMSALNEPFKAEIDVTALRPDERDNLQVRIASDTEFDKAGLNRSIFLGQLQFDIIQRNGQDKILITSGQAVKEPFLDFLLSATAGSGVLLREYTVLLDPPEYVLAETRRATTTQATRETTAQVETKPTTTRYQYAAGSGQSASSYSVKRNDTLWNVALKTRPIDSISVHQMMMALLNANRSAFTDENVNGLRAGVTLQIPSQSQINALSKAAAQAAFAEQNEAWKNRNKATAPADVQTEPAAEQTADATAGTGDTATVAETQADTAEVTGDSADTATVTDPESRLQLVAPEEVNTSDDDASPNVQGDEDIRQLTEQLTLAQETIEAQTQENIDFKSRMDAMEEQLETMRRLISLKDADLARLQDMLEEEDPALAAEAAVALQGDETAVTDVASQEMADSEPSSTAPTDVDSQANTDAASNGQTDSSEQPEEGFIDDAAKALNLDQQQVQSSIGKIKQFVTENKLLTALGLLLVLLILWLIARRSSREVTWDEAVKKMDKADKKEAAAAAVVAPAFEDDITDAPLDEEHNEQKSVGELVEQADMFVGYADYVQAKTSLEHARNIEPENTLVAYKLLFVLYKQQQADEFRTLVQESTFDKDSFEWQEIKNWGQQLLPGDELFVEQAPAQAASSTQEPVTEADSNDSAEPVADNRQDDHLEFDLNDFADTPPEEPVESEEQEHKPASEEDDELLAFDTNYGLDEKADTEETDDTLDESVKLDIDADNAKQEDRVSFDEADEDQPLEMDTMESEDTILDDDTDDEPDLEFDIGDLDDIDEAETKLDLAGAYVDMGDPDGARSILNEVLVEGNEEQKKRAHELLNTLS